MAAKVIGMDRLTSRLTRTPKRVESEVTGELRRIGRDLMQESQGRAPFKEGDLRSSAYSRVSPGPNGPELEVGYSGPEGYLLVMHEGGWLNFMGRYGPKKIENYATPGTGAKFLENPWTENLPRYKQRVREAMRKGLRDG